MTVPSDSFQTPTRVRPGTVTTSGYLLFGIGLVSLLGLVTALASYPTIRDVFASAYKGTPVEKSSGTVAVFALVASIVPALFFGIGAVILAPLVLKGRQPARIITWVLCGLLACCQAVGVAGSGINAGTFGQSGTTNGVDPQAVARQLADSLPGWVRPTQIATAALLLIFAIVVVVLLALPASNAFFRKQPEQWAPPAYPTV
jgi:hypothetical protein